MTAATVCASSRAGTMMSTCGNSGGAAGGNSGADCQNFPWAKTKYSQIDNDRRAIISSNRLIQRFCQARKRLGAGCGHDPTVFQTNSELTGNVESGFVGKAHAGLQRGLIAVHKVSGLVAVQADAVAGAVGKSRQLVAGAPAF